MKHLDDISGAEKMDNLMQAIEDIVCEAGAVFSVLENEYDVSEAERILYREIEKRSTTIRSERATYHNAADSDFS